jgi:NADH-quinone oxidoreductase subunit K
MLLDQSRFIIIGTLLFFIGLSGIMLNRRNIIIILMSIELILLAINFNFVIFSVFLDDFIGQIFAFFILTVAAAESAIGLAIYVIFFRIRGTVSIEYINLLKG